MFFAKIYNLLKHGIIKKVLKIGLLTIATLLILVVSLWLLIRASSVQTWLTRKYIAKFEEQIGCDIRFGKVKVRLPNQIHIEDLVIWDQLGDTLLAIPKTLIGIQNYNLKAKEFNLSLVKLTDPFFYIQEDPGGGMNLAFILESLRPDSGLIQVPDIRIDKIIFDNGRFRYHKFMASPFEGRFTPDYFELSEISLTANSFQFNNEELNLDIHELNAVELSGLKLNDAQLKILLKDELWYFKDIELETANSLLLIPELNIKYDPDESRKALDRLIVDAYLSAKTMVSESDLQFFLPDFSGTRDIYLSGGLNIAHSNFHWIEASLLYEGLANYEGNISITGIQDLLDADYTLSIDTMWYSPDAHDSSLPGLLVKIDTLDLPFYLDSLGTLGFTGMFSGNMKSFSTSGSFQSLACSLNGNLNTKQGDEPGSRQVNGSIIGRVRDLDNIIETHLGIEEIEINGVFDGTVTDLEEFNMNLDFHFPLLNYRKYGYKDLILKGRAIDKTFDGLVLIQDDNIDLALEAVMDFHKQIPSFSIEMSVKGAHLNTLNISALDSLEVLDFDLHASFSGICLENLEGQIWITDSYYQNSRGKLPIKDINLTIGPELGKRKINLVSDYIDARIVGDIYLDAIVHQLQWVGRRFLPLNISPPVPESSNLNDFSFNIQLKNPKPLTEILTPEIIFKDNTQVSGSIERGGLEWEIEGFSPQYVISEKQFTDLAFRVVSVNDSISLTSSLSKLQFNRYTELEDLQFALVMTPEQLTSELRWDNLDTLLTKGKIDAEIRFEPGMGKWPRSIVSIPQTQIIYKDSVWNISPFQLVMDKFLFRFDSLKIQHNEETLLVNGAISDLPHDTLYFEFHKLNLDHINTFKGAQGKFGLTGIVDGDARFFDLHQKGLFLADLQISDFAVNSELLGHTQISSSRHAGEKSIYMEVLSTRGDISTFGLKGSFNPINDEIDFDLNLEKLKMNLFNGVLNPVLRDIRGIATGHVDISGTRSDPLFNGDIFLQKAAFYVDYLNTRYTFTHPVKVTPSGFLIQNLIARDKDGNEAIVNGGVFHNKFKNLRLDLQLNVTDFLCLDTNEAIGNAYWGKAYANGFASISGPIKNIKIYVDAASTNGTDFYVPVSHQRKIKEIDFITFVNKENEYLDPDLFSYTDQPKDLEYDVDLTGVEVSLDIEVNPLARVQIIIDPQTGDEIRVRGRGNLHIDVNTRGLFNISGDYLINQGDYQFTLQNMPLKRFEIEPGGRVMLNGPISRAQIDLDANYSTSAVLYDLVLDETNTDLRQRVPVECHLLMNGRLENPGLKFDIVLPPNSDDIARSQLSNLSQDEMNIQIFSLLILNKFSPLPGLSSSAPRSYESAGIATTTEVLSNQLNYLLSQISSDFDVGFNYRPGDELTSDEVAVALKAQLLEDRMTINVNGNVDVRSVETDANQLVGDVQVEYKITPSGKLMVKAFTRANDRLLYEYSQYTQGFGVFFREEFDSFGGLLRKYWDGIFKK
ncbi:MAG: translocation/assembly module TamB domain-containing protein [Bacteroidota bacterium]|nr:translocation/assembly module TamB domain-containing protein [Bacteroidota bacterium]